MRLSVGVLFVAGLALAGCGTTTTDRAVSGAGIGAAGGAVAGALVGDPLIGAAAGAAVGGAVGAATDSNDIYLGKPVWK
jgi:osmotically inducible lipoprotein OsmB